MTEPDHPIPRHQARARRQADVAARRRDQRRIRAAPRLLGRGAARERPPSSASGSPQGETLTTSSPRRSPRSRRPAGAWSARPGTSCGLPITWDMVPYDVQLIGGDRAPRGQDRRDGHRRRQDARRHDAALPERAPGRGVHLVTVNDYLARRDSEWMGEIFKFLGLTVGLHPEPDGPRRAPRGLRLRHHVRHQQRVRLRLPARQHGRASEHRVQRGFDYAIVDEVDSVLIDEARTPLIISGPVEHSLQQYDELKPRSSGWCASQAAGDEPDPGRGREAAAQDPEKEDEARAQAAAGQARRAQAQALPLSCSPSEPGLKRLIQQRRARLHARQAHARGRRGALLRDRREGHSRRPARSRGASSCRRATRTASCCPTSRSQLAEIDERRDALARGEGAREARQLYRASRRAERARSTTSSSC